MRTHKVLTEQQAEFFLENGYIVIKQAFTKQKATDWSRDVWVRLGMDPNDKSTWTKERIHMPWHKREKVSTFAPKAWEAMQDLLGEGRIDEDNSTWGDSFIVNLGTSALEAVTEDTHPRDLDNWHVDGDFFVHYLDSPEQALLVIPLFSDIKPRGGGTYTAPEGIDMVARYLAAHPEGAVPAAGRLVPSTTTYTDPAEDPEGWTHREAAPKCSKFVEMTGEIGDVVLMHPLMLHSASKNYLREARIIINPPVSLKAPFDLNREDSKEFSLVERKTLQALGVDKVAFKPMTERRRLVPKSMSAKNAMLKEEKRRLEESEGQSRAAPAVTVGA